MELPEPDNLVELVSQQTLDTNDNQKVERLTLNVWAINDIRRRQRARQWTRRNAPTAVNFLQPDVESTEQSELGNFITNALDAEFGEVEIVVVRPVTI